LSRRVFLLIHGPYGTGKTTLANTAPGPRLVLDAEGGSYDVDKTIYLLDPEELTLHTYPAMEPIPWAGAKTVIDKDATVIVDIVDYRSYRLALDLVKTGNHPFNTVILDSLTEIQKQLKDALRPVTFGDYVKADYDVWDQLLEFMEADVRSFRDLKRPSSKRPVNFVIVAASNVEEHPRRPVLQGGLRKSLPGFVDLEGYLHVEYVADEEKGTTTKRRVLDISPHDDAPAEVKCRLRLLEARYGDKMWDPTIGRIISTVNPKPKATAATTPEGN
jgi:AAA domain